MCFTGVLPACLKPSIQSQLYQNRLKWVVLWYKSMTKFAPKWASCPTVRYKIMNSTTHVMYRGADWSSKTTGATDKEKEKEKEKGFKQTRIHLTAFPWIQMEGKIFNFPLGDQNRWNIINKWTSSSSQSEVHNYKSIIVLICFTKIWKKGIGKSDERHLSLT